MYPRLFSSDSGSATELGYLVTSISLVVAVVFIVVVIPASAMLRRQLKREQLAVDLREPLLSPAPMPYYAEPRNDTRQYSQTEQSAVQGLTLQLTATTFTVC